jgi:predicted TPR repeat methyltransferase
MMLAAMSTFQQILQSAVDAHRTGKLADAERLYKQVLGADPRNVDGLRLLGLVAQAVGKHDVALQLIGRAVKFHPRSAEAWNDLAGVHAEMGRSAEAVEAYRKAIELKPHFAPARNNLGDVLSRMGRIDEALACWREAIRLDPKLPEPYYNIGRALFTQGKVDEAVQAYRQAIGAMPGFAPAQNNLGAVLWAAGRKKEASECFCRAVDLNGNYAEAWNNLGSAWDEGGKRDEALECWRKAIHLRPDYADAHKNLGVALEKKGDRAAAIREWEEALRLRPGWEEPAYYLAAAKAGNVPTPTGPPADYVAKLFDEYADKFDQHLLETLQYRVPDLLVEAVKRAGCEKLALVMDLGCGTGLCGAKFRSMAGRLIGVDLSPRMIEKSQERGIYDELVVGGLEEALGGQSEIDLILAGDVLGYVGELSGVFKAAADSLRRGGHFVFSAEKASEDEGEGVLLRSTRRFAHSHAYLQKLAGNVGLEVVEMSDAVIRIDDKQPIDGIIAVLRNVIGKTSLGH